MLIMFTLLTIAQTWQPVLAMEYLSNSMIDRAVRYGLENQGEGLSSFLGSNWREGTDGSLLNIYTPFMEIARSASHQGLTATPTPDDVTKARKEVVEDVDYIWHHPRVKFMFSLFGDRPDFAKTYFAQIEGSGKGRSVTLYPVQSIPQYLAEYDKNIQVKPYSAINSYHFKYEDLAPLDEFTIKLYGKGLQTISFRVNARDIR